VILPFTPPDYFSYQKRVFAHYFYPFSLQIGSSPAAADYYNTQYLAPGGEKGIHAAYGGYLRSRPLALPTQNSQIANMQTEVRMAIARGITGFTFDILSLADALSPVGHLNLMLQAAAAVDTRFWVVPMLDMSSLVGLTQAQAVQLISSFMHPSYARLPDGRLLITAFNASFQPILWWQQVITALNLQDVDMAFIPIFLGGPASNPLATISHGFGGWGTATPAAAAAAPPCMMMPVLPQQFRPKDQIFWEAGNTASFRAGWMNAIQSNAQYVQIVTWSDFSESGQVQPYTDATLNPSIGTAFYDLTAYYAAWFVSGVQPPIVADRLYWCYRRMGSTAAHSSQPDAFKVVGAAETSNIEALAFLTASGTVVINGAATACPAGITSVMVPTAPGTPQFRLQRDGSDVFEFKGLQIYGSGGSPSGTLDLTYWGGSHP